MKNIAIFGSTGSIGKQSLQVIEKFPEDFKVIYLTAEKNKNLLEEQSYKFLSKKYLGKLNEYVIDEIVRSADIIINAVPGFDGLFVSISALKNAKILLAANKESFVVAGKYLRNIAAASGAEIRPIDSEASAIWQLSNEYGENAVSSITITCSGGPFFGKKAEELVSVSVDEALNHPTWKMGPKISVDSATLINKVFEVIELSSIFNIDLSKINIVVHRQSFVHGMIHTKTGATKMHIAPNHMTGIISHALFYPDENKFKIDFKPMKRSEVSFHQPDEDTFRSLKWLKLHKGNPLFPVVLNALNEVAVRKFLNHEIKFMEIYDFIERGFEKYLWKKPPTDILELINFHKEITGTYESSNIISGR